MGSEMCIRDRYISICNKAEEIANTSKTSYCKNVVRRNEIDERILKDVFEKWRVTSPGDAI